jgi:hypothetical protein
VRWSASVVVNRCGSGTPERKVIGKGIGLASSQVKEFLAAGGFDDLKMHFRLRFSRRLGGFCQTSSRVDEELMQNLRTWRQSRRDHSAWLPYPQAMLHCATFSGPQR